MLANGDRDNCRIANRICSISWQWVLENVKDEVFIFRGVYENRAPIDLRGVAKTGNECVPGSAGGTLKGFLCG
jgi:hypothetical protein